MKIRKDDSVLVIAGKDKGKKGKVLRSLPNDGRLVVEGVNIRKKHVRAKKAGQKGQIVDMPSAFSASNVKIICGKCSKATKVKYRVEGKNKTRVCKKCGADI